LVFRRTARLNRTITATNQQRDDNTRLNLGAGFLFFTLARTGCLTNKMVNILFIFH
jgi:hypothetical protein